MATVEQQTDLVTLEIDGREVQAPKGSMIIEASDRMGIEIPRFCYHRKLSIAANCRMCLVDVEKAPKPLPACATPVADGMKVFTQSRRALDAQRGVMEFLLINHPLDCPICDQGGECELQDLSMGYGRSVSRFTERKRVVKDKNLGPLVSTDMTRCIHCTRCVRFLEEVAGTAELGGVGRGEHMEISTFVERNINSELSGNIIDLCPVGALNNKPFRFSARAWEMTARPYIGTHDCVGSNLYYHTFRGRIMRAVPKDVDAVNECWLSDRDRFSHFGLYAEDRLTAPRIKVDGEWRDTDWETALGEARDALAGVREAHGGAQLGFLISPRATCEEHYLFQKLAREMDCDNVDHRLGIADFSDPRAGRARLDRATAEWAKSDAIFLVGSNLRQEQPILGHRVRTAWRVNGARVADLNPVAFDFHFDLTKRLIVPPQHMVESLARVAKAALDITSAKAPDGELGRLIEGRKPEPDAVLIAEMLRDAEAGMLVLGDIALNHSQAAWLRKLAEFIAETLEVSLNVLPGPANSEGAWRAGAVPQAGNSNDGLNAQAMLREPRKGYLLWDLEPEFDLASPAEAVEALGAAEKLVAVTAFAGSTLLETADVLLPLAPVLETAGSYVNADGLRQSFAAAGKIASEAREGWKILRMLGSMLGAEGFDFTRLEAVSDAIEELPAPTGPDDLPAPDLTHEHAFFRIGDVPWTASDALVRRSQPLQESAHGDNHWAMMHPATADELTVATAENVAVSQNGESVELPLKLDRRVPPGAVWVRSATCSARVLGAAYGPIKVERA